MKPAVVKPAVDPISRTVAQNLCTGCGACAGLFPDHIRMENDPVTGLRPVVSASPAGQRAAEQAIKVCGGRGMDHASLPAHDAIDRDWGPVLECWEGWAADPQIRFRGSSGGAVTALMQFMLQAQQADGIMHVAASDKNPRLNETVISRTRADLMRGAGSRYAPASPCDRLGEIANGDQKIAFVGKPCDVASAKRAAAQDPRLADKLAVTVSIFCAGTPSHAATDHLLDRLGVPKGADVTSIRYRGEGWPGEMQATYRMPNGARVATETVTYAQGWGETLQAGRPWRCRICADHTGEFADISVGDPWHNPPSDQATPGRSLIVARTEKGRAIVEAAIAAGALVAEDRDRTVIAAAQPNLLETRGAVWGRRLAMRVFGMAVPQDQGLNCSDLWRTRLSLRQQAQSVAGTLKRIWRRRLWQAARVTEGAR